MVTSPHRPDLDPLTWLPNRALFEARLVRAVREVERRRFALALLLIDLDRMEQVNATLGQDFGDRILREAAARMSRGLGAGAVLGRLQSDDFAAFFEVSDAAAAMKQAATVLDLCAKPYILDCVAAIVTVSIGVALEARDAGDPATLLARAERALNEAKIRGRDRFYPGELKLC
jgi:diguanylate cyclase (GGDEF)-like protein